MKDNKSNDGKASIDYKHFFLFLCLLGFCGLSWILFLVIAKNLLALIF